MRTLPSLIPLRLFPFPESVLFTRLSYTSRCCFGSNCSEDPQPPSFRILPPLQSVALNCGSRDFDIHLIHDPFSPISPPPFTYFASQRTCIQTTFWCGPLAFPVYIGLLPSFPFPTPRASSSFASSHFVIFIPIQCLACSKYSLGGSDMGHQLLLVMLLSLATSYSSLSSLTRTLPSYLLPVKNYSPMNGGNVIAL